MTMKAVRYGKTLTQVLERSKIAELWPTHFQAPLRSKRHFSESSRRLVIKPVPLADIGEGIREVQIIQWFVEPEARVEQFQKLVEVQSDKASVEITAMYDGVIKKLHYNAEDVAQVGKALYDMDIQQEINPEDEAFLSSGGQERETPSQSQVGAAEQPSDEKVASPETPPVPPSEPKSRFASLATPAVRGLLKEYFLKIEDITGTGKDGRVLKEDVYSHVASQTSTQSTPQPSTTQTETPVPLTPIQAGMFKTMTRSLSIPHFLYTDNLDLTSLSALRARLSSQSKSPQKISSLAFITKAVSLALAQYPMLNARLDTTDPAKPRVLHRSHHNIGIAMDTPQGLLVPNIKNVAAHSISSLAAEISRLSSLARQSKLSPADLSGGTFTISNVGSIGGAVVAPVIVSSEVAILGIGKTKAMPMFDETGAVMRAEMCAFSWSADHRVCDGATVARCSEVVRGYLEEIENMVLDLR